MCTPKPSQRLAASAGRLRRGIGRGIKALLSPARTLGSHIPTSVSYPRTLREYGSDGSLVFGTDIWV